MTTQCQVSCCGQQPLAVYNIWNQQNIWQENCLQEDNVGGKGVENSELSVKSSRGLQRKGGIVLENYLFIFYWNRDNKT